MSVKSFTETLPVTLKLPVISCTSPIESPNLVDPDEKLCVKYDIDEETINC